MKDKKDFYGYDRLEYGLARRKYETVKRLTDVVIIALGVLLGWMLTLII